MQLLPYGFLMLYCMLAYRCNLVHPNIYGVSVSAVVIFPSNFLFLGTLSFLS